MMQFNQFPVGAVQGNSRATPDGLIACNMHADPEDYASLLQNGARGLSSDLNGGMSSAVALSKFHQCPPVDMKAAVHGTQSPRGTGANTEEQFLRDASHAFAQGCVDIEDVMNEISRAPEPSITELEVPQGVEPKIDQRPPIDIEASLERAQSPHLISTKRDFQYQNELANKKEFLPNSHKHSHSCGNLAPLNGLHSAAEGDMAHGTTSKPRNQCSRSSSPAPPITAQSLFNEIEHARCMRGPPSPTTPISAYGDTEDGQDVVAEAGMPLIPWQEGSTSDTVGSLAPISPARSTFDQVDVDNDSTTAADREEEVIEEVIPHSATEVSFEPFLNGFVDFEDVSIDDTV